jgi:hypothetical protein
MGFRFLGSDLSGEDGEGIVSGDADSFLKVARRW